MSTVNLKRTNIILLIVIALLLGWDWNLMWKLSRLRMEANYAWIAIVDHKNIIDTLDRMSISDEVSYLEIYSRSNNAAFVNPSINRVVEFEKNRTLNDIIDDLKKKTQNDLGNNPNTWIQKYHYGSTNTMHN